MLLPIYNSLTQVLFTTTLDGYGVLVVSLKVRATRYAPESRDEGELVRVDPKP